MTTEEERTLEALNIAIQMEIDGKEFYLKSSQESGDEMGRRLLSSLADEEDIHRQKFSEIYDAIRAKKEWPRSYFQPDGGKGIRTVFAEALEASDKERKAPASELEAVQTAMAMENKTYDFYKSLGEKAGQDAEREFYESLASQEREHHLILLDYYEYLKDPAAWFVGKEHPSLDGG